LWQCIKKKNTKFKGYNNTSILKVVATNEKEKPLARLLKAPIMKQGANKGHKVKTTKTFMKLL
jgi:hypothetical protein